MIRLINALGAEKILPITMSFSRVPLDIEVPSQPLYGRDGDVVTGESTLRSRAFTLEGSIYHPDKSQIEQEADALLAFLMQMPLKVYRQHHHDRYLMAYPQGAMQDWLDAGAELQLRIPMIALDPYWYGSKVHTVVAGTQSIVVAGNAATHPLIRTTSSVSGLQFKNHRGNQELKVQASGIIEVDNDRFTCKVNGANRMDAVNEEWLVQGLKLLPGSNTIETNAEVEIFYRPRWY